jgi:hypothetical protein
MILYVIEMKNFVHIAHQIRLTGSYALLAAHCSLVPVPQTRIVDLNMSWFFIVAECLCAETLLGCSVTLGDAASKVPWEPELHLEPLSWSPPTMLPRRLGGFNGGLSLMTPEPEVHFELLCLTRLLSCWRLSGCNGRLSTITGLLELHLDWSLSTAVSRSCTFSWGRSWIVIISGGVSGGNVKMVWGRWWKDFLVPYILRHLEKLRLDPFTQLYFSEWESCATHSGKWELIREERLPSQFWSW